jgi:NADH-quinone oxidoreductase subunit E
MTRQKIDIIIKSYVGKKGIAVPLLQEINTKFGYLPKGVLEEIANKINLPLSQLYSLATFYKSFRLQPQGRHKILVCLGTACHVRGAGRVVEKLERELGIKRGETSKDSEFSLDVVNCLGVCALGPLMVLDGRYYGEISPNKVDKILKKILRKK